MSWQDFPTAPHTLRVSCCNPRGRGAETHYSPSSPLIWSLPAPVCLKPFNYNQTLLEPLIYNQIDLLSFVAFQASCTDFLDARIMGNRVSCPTFVAPTQATTSSFPHFFPPPLSPFESSLRRLPLFFPPLPLFSSLSFPMLSSSQLQTWETAPVLSWVLQSSPLFPHNHIVPRRG